MKEMNSVALIDAGLQFLKKCQRSYYARSYADLSIKLSWFQTPEGKVAHHELSQRLKKECALQSILIFKPDDIGDAVYALPAIAALKRSLPLAKISLLCQKKTAPLYERSGLFDEIVAVDVRVRALRFQSFNVEEVLEKFSTPLFDLAIFLRTYPAFFGSFAKVKARCKIHPLDPRLSSASPFQVPVSLWGETRAHQVIQLGELVSLLTGQRDREAAVVFPSFQFTKQDEKEVLQSLGGKIPERYFVVHPFAKFETRRYPEKYWREILSEIQQRLETKLLIIGGKEDPRWEGLGDVTQLQGALNLGATGYLLKHCQGFIGNESGPGHWASAMGVPTVFLMGGHSDPLEWGPLNSLVLMKEVPCAPCHLRACPKYHVRCLTELKPEDNLPQILRFLSPQRALK